MQTEQREELKQRFDFEAWRERNLLGSTATLKPFELGDNDLPGWRIRRRSDNPAVRPPVLKTVWTPRSGSDQGLLSIAVSFCDSLQAAHEQLLDWLGDFESTAVKERSELQIGDVAFGISEPWMLLFARANVVVLVRNAGPRLVGVHDEARALDSRIISQVRGPSPQVP